MVKSSSTKIDLLEYFYEHLNEEDWLEGVDLYQGGKVSEVKDIYGLMTGVVKASYQPVAEVRLKLHPSGKVIQWIECTCKKNRRHGQYCEHIAALMIHIDREKSSFISNLDIKMPLKPPSTTKKSKVTVSALAKSNDKESSTSTESTKKFKGASQALLNHLKGSIHSIALISHGPKLRIKIEIKPGVLTNYDLDIDAAANFLLNNKKDNAYSNELKKLKVFANTAELGSRIFLRDAEKITAERCAIINLEKTSIDTNSLPATLTLDSYTRVQEKGATGEEHPYLFAPLKGTNRNIGDEFFFISGHGYWPLDRSLVKPEWFELPLTKTLKEDEAAKWVQNSYEDYLNAGPIWLDKDLKKPQVLNVDVISEIKIHSEKDGWFRLDPRYKTGNSNISMSSLMRQAQKNKRKFVKTGDVWLKIPDFMTQFQWDLDQDEDHIKVDALGLLRLKAASGGFDNFVGSQQVLQNVQKKIEFTPSDDLPNISCTKLDLRGYQSDGLKWLWWLYKNHLHGLLADDMGLGKTHQAMALMSSIQEDLRLKEKETGEATDSCCFLVISPTTVLDHWEDKINAFAPNLKPLKYHGPKRLHLLSSLDKTHNTLVTSYGVLLRDTKKLCEIPWKAIILDEAHYVKNNNTATYRAACKLKSRIRLCLTGTPMENHLGELKNLFDFLVPGYLGSDDFFRKKFMLPIQNKDLETEVALQKLIHPLKLRRNKKQVLSDLPAKIEDIRKCTLSNEQVKLYRDIIDMRARPLMNQLSEESTPVPYLHVFAILQMLKQVCNHPALLNDSSNYKDHESGKFELLKELISEALDSGNKIVIFSQYVKMIRIIEHYCKEQNIVCVSMTGQTRNRGKVIERFQTDPEVKIFAGSLLAGGVGIDLTAASVVIHYDRWWNASKEDQATDRVHRIGQKKFVQVLKLVSKGTLEEKIDQMIQKKQSIFNRFLERDEEIFKTMTRQDLIELLQ